MKAIPFSELKDFRTCTVNDIPVLFSDYPILNDTLPEGVYAYDLRWDNLQDDFGSIEPSVMVDYAATIVTMQSVEMNEDGYGEIHEYGFDDEDVTVAQWMEQNRPQTTGSGR